MKNAARMLVSIWVVQMCLSSQALAAKCGSVTNITGDSCSNLDFDLDLSECEDPAPSAQPKVVCNSGAASATVVTAQNTYVVKFKQGPEKWGVRPWIAGDVVQIPAPAKKKPVVLKPAPRPVAKPVVMKPAVAKPVVAAPVAKPAPVYKAPEVNVAEASEAAPEVSGEAPATVERAPASGAPPVLIARIDPPRPVVSAPAPEPAPSAPPSIDPATKIRGFVDAQYRYIRGDSFNSGAVINDGALYFSHSKDNAEVVIDIPFAWEKNSKDIVDIDADSQSNAFILGRNRPQAYVAYTLGNTKVQLGQFDTPYGYEVNDAPDITLTSQGWVWNKVAPFTHTGLMITQTIGSFYVKALAANAMNEGAQVNRNGEYGVQFAYSGETLRGGVGFLTGSKSSATGYADNRVYTDVLFGLTLGKFVLDTEFSIVKEPGANQGTAFFILPVYNFTKEFSAAVRYEYLDAISDQTGSQTTAGVQYQLTDALRLKLDFTFNSLKVGAADPVEGRAGAMAAVYKF